MGTTDDFATSFLHFSLFSTALWDLPNSRPVHSLMLSSYLFRCLPCLLPPFTVPCKMVLARPDKWETRPYYCSLHLFMSVRRSLCGPTACWILAPCILLWSSAGRIHDSQAYRKMDVTMERISRIFELREILLSIQTGFSLVNAAVVCYPGEYLCCYGLK